MIATLNNDENAYLLRAAFILFLFSQLYKILNLNVHHCKPVYIVYFKNVSTFPIYELVVNEYFSLTDLSIPDLSIPFDLS